MDVSCAAEAPRHDRPRAAKAPHYDRLRAPQYHHVAPRYILAVFLAEILAWPGGAVAGAQSQSKAAAASPFTSSQAQLLLLFVEKPDENVDELISTAAEGWTIFKDLKPPDGKPRTYVLFADPANGAFADPSSFVEQLRPYVATAPGNLLKADARLPIASKADVPDTSGSDSDSAEPPPASEWRFTSDAGLILFFVKPANRAQFEAVLEKVRAASPDGRVSTAAFGGKSAVFRIADATPTGLQIYALFISPVVHGADYAFGPLLGRALEGAARQEAYSNYTASLSGANLFDLKRVDEGK